nr:Ig-like domain repeat protein [Schumannella luteola]
MTGALPKYTSSEYSAFAPNASWYNPTTGYPYKLSYGWTSSTGGANDNHEISTVSATTLAGPVPVITLAGSTSTAPKGGTGTYTVTPTVSPDGGSEDQPVVVTTTFPAGTTPTTPTTLPTGWTCAAPSGQAITCTYTPTAAVAAGTALPALNLPYSVPTSTNVTGTALNVTSASTSNDSLPASGTGTITVAKGVTTTTETVNNAATATVAYGTAANLRATVAPSAATGTVTFTSVDAANNPITLCTATLTGGAATCATSTTLAAGTYPITATYSGDTQYATSTVSSATLTVNKAGAPTLTTTAAGATSGGSVVYGNGTPLNLTGIPAGVDGTSAVQFVVKDSAGTIVDTVNTTVANLATATSKVLPAGTGYTVIGTWAGDASHVGAAGAQASFAVTKATAPALTTISTATVTYGNHLALGLTGIPADAPGTSAVTFTIKDSAGNTVDTVTTTVANLATAQSKVLPVGTYTVQGTWAGDANRNAATGTTSNSSVVKANSPTLTTTATATTTYGNQLNLGLTGIPADAAGTGTVTLTVRNSVTNAVVDTVTTTVANLATAKSKVLPVGSYTTTGVWAGDANYNGATGSAAGSTVTKANSPALTTTATATTTYGNQLTLGMTGIPADAVGTSVVTLTVRDAANNVVDTVTTTVANLATAKSKVLPVGSYTTTGVWAGDANYNGTTGTSASSTVTQATPPALTTTATATTTYGNQLALGLSGIPADATGTSAVTFTVRDAANNVVDTVTTTVANLATAKSKVLPVGTYTTTGVWAGDANYAQRAGTAAGSTVTKAATSLTTTAQGPQSYGTPVPLGLTGIPADAVGTSVVTLTVRDAANNVVDTVTTTVANLANAKSKVLPAGSYTVVGDWAGDANHSASTGTQATFTVTPAGAATLTTTAQGPQTYGTQVPVGLTGIPADAVGTSVVTFDVKNSSGVTVDTVSTTVANLATAKTKVLPAGDYTAVGTWAGDANHATATGSAAPFTVTKAASTTATTATGKPYGTPVPLGVTGLPADADPASSISIAITTRAGTPVTTVTTTVGQLGTAQVAGLLAGDFTARATWAGDANHTSSVASPADFTVAKAASPALTTTASNVAYGMPIPLGLSGIPADATGSSAVTLVVKNAAGDTVDTVTTTVAGLPNAKSKLLPAGNYTVVGTWAGDANHTGADGAVATATVAKIDPTLTTTATGPQTYGTPVPLGLSGIPADATGSSAVTLTVKDAGGNVVDTVTTTVANLANAKSKVLPAGSYTVVGDWAGDANHNAATGAQAAFTVTPVAAPTLTTTAAGPKAYGTPVPLGLTGVPADASGSGAVTFDVKNSAGDTVQTVTTTVAQLASAQATGLPAGDYTVVGTWAGDANHTGATGSQVGFAVTKAASTLATTATGKPYGTPVPLGVTGLPADADPASVITIAIATAAGTPVTTVTTTVGQLATAQVSGLLAGDFTATASWAGDANHTASNATAAPFTVSKAASPALTTTATGVPFGTPIPLGLSGIPADATGSSAVTLLVKNAAGDTVDTVTTTVADLAAAKSKILPAGDYTVTGTWAGDANHTGADGAVANVTVAKAAAPALTTTAQGPQAYGTPVPLGLTGIPAGADGASAVTLVVKDAGGATVDTVTTTVADLAAAKSKILPAGDYTVIGTWAGDANHVGADGSSVGFTVTPRDTALTATVDGKTSSSVAYGGSPAFAATGLPGGATPATGTISFVVSGGPADGTVLCTATLPATTCSPSAVTLPVGSYSVVAQYSGDADNAPSTSGPVTLEVTAAPTSLTLATPPAATYGTPVTLDASGLPEAASGTIEYRATRDGETVVLCRTDIDTSTSCATPATLPAGEYSVVAVFIPTPGSPYAGSTSAAKTLTVAKAAPTVNATVDGDPASASHPYGVASTLAVTGLPADATGTITFTYTDASGSHTLCSGPVTNGGVSCATVATLPAGSYAITASYSGDANYAAATGNALELTVTQAEPTVTITAPAQSEYGQPFTVTLGDELPTDATGTVKITDQDGTLLCTVTLPARSCEITAVLPVRAGGYQLTPTYSGDANHTPATGSPVTVTVTEQATSLTAKANGSDAATTTYGTAATLSASGLPAGATGLVSFTYVDGDGVTRTLCSENVGADGTVSCTGPAALGAGEYDITAVYEGDANHQPTTSPAVTLTVQPAGTGVVVEQPSGAVFGTATTVTAGNIPDGASGQLTFRYTDADGVSHDICTVSLPTRECELPADLPAGTYPVTVQYSGDADHAGSTSPAVNVVVAKQPTDVQFASDAPTTAVYGTAATLPVTGLPTGATGEVDVIAIGAGGAETVLCRITLPATSCATPTDLPGGTYTIVPRYLGDANHEASQGAALTFTVTPSTTPLGVTVAENKPVWGGAVTLTATELPAAATGTVTFREGTTVLCTVNLPTRSCQTSVLKPGEHTVTASYSGDASFAPAAAETTTTVSIISTVDPQPEPSTTSTSKITWPATPGAAGYRVIVSTSPDFSNPIPGWNGRGVAGTETSIDITDLDPSTKYYFRVVGVDADGVVLSTHDGIIVTAATPPATGPGSGLAATGVNGLAGLLGGLGMLAAGAALVLLRLRRRRADDEGGATA